MNEQLQKTALVIGAGSTIAAALIKSLLASNSCDRIVAVSRGRFAAMDEAEQDKLHYLQSDYSEDSMARIAARLEREGVQINQVFLCNGILHDADVFPEKRLDDIHETSLQKVTHVNAFVPLLWLKHLRPLLKGKRPCVVTAFSARVGSIADNGHGGWYAYRASKAALNMLFKTAAIEIRRLAPNVQFLAFHPGTTDTPLSEPFQKNVPANKLFKPAEVADRLLNLVDKLTGDVPLHFLDWEGKKVEW